MDSYRMLTSDTILEWIIDLSDTKLPNMFKPWSVTWDRTWIRCITEWDVLCWRRLGRRKRDRSSRSAQSTTSICLEWFEKFPLLMKGSKMVKRKVYHHFLEFNFIVLIIICLKWKVFITSFKYQAHAHGSLYSIRVFPIHVDSTFQ